MRICSLLPSATEILYTLGLGDDIVAISHECDFPPAAREKPAGMRCRIEPSRMTSEEINRAVGDCMQRGESLYELDVPLLTTLRPDLIVTQELCDVCALDTKHVTAALGSLPGRPAVVSLHPHTITEVFADMREIGRMTMRVDEASGLIASLERRIANVRERVAGRPRPRVACIEWFSPLMACGHWVPEQVDAAGGVEVLSGPGQPSRTIAWDDVVAARPEVVVLLPCGLPIAQARRELAGLTSRPGWGALPAVANRRVFLVDGPAYFNRSGPRLVDGIELLADLLHPSPNRRPWPAEAVEAVAP